jgi:hypothetical protein
LYTVTTDDRSQQQVDALPAEVLTAFAEARTVLEIAPWNGAPYHKLKPDSPHASVIVRPGRSG